METSNGVNKKNLPLILAFGIPLVMIVAIALSIYLPGLGKQPKYNFLYMTGDALNYGYPNGTDYYVQGNRLVKSPVPPPVNPDPYLKAMPPGEVKFYVHDVIANQSKEVSPEEAQNLNLNSSQTSEDSYTIQQGGGGDFLFGGGGDYNSWYLKGNNRSKKLNLKLSGPNSYASFRFLGWIE